MRKVCIRVVAAAVLASSAAAAVPVAAVQVLADEPEGTDSASDEDSTAPSSPQENSGGDQSGQSQDSSAGSGSNAAAESGSGAGESGGTETGETGQDGGTDISNSDGGDSAASGLSSDASSEGGISVAGISTDIGQTGGTADAAQEFATDVTAETAETAAEAVTTVNEEDLGEPEDYALADAYTGTNEELIAQQHIVTDMPVIHRDFRFYQVDKEYAFARSNLNILEERSEDADTVGTIPANGMLYILEEENDGWVYVESGDARGFLESDQLVTGDDAQQLLTILENESERIAALLPEGVGEKINYVLYATATVPSYENDAYAYRRITTQNPVVDKVFAIAGSDVAILEEDSSGARTAGNLSEGGIAYLISRDGEWDYIESGNVRGFVKDSDLDIGSSVDEQVNANGESSYSTAEEMLDPSENKATYYTLTSVKEGTKYNEVREKILELALSCVGNPYVWGGTSLTNGADCSGFVQTLYARFGYSLPRVASDQSTYGTQIPVSDAQPGDLIFFARNGYVYHVAMYAGDGKTVEAYCTKYGIVTKSLDNRNAVWATRIIQD